MEKMSHIDDQWFVNYNVQVYPHHCFMMLIELEDLGNDFGAK